jgi:hypothetical protein
MKPGPAKVRAFLSTSGIDIRLDIRKVGVRDSGYPQIQASAFAAVIFKSSFKSKA